MLRLWLNRVTGISAFWGFGVRNKMYSLLRRCVPKMAWDSPRGAHLILGPDGLAQLVSLSYPQAEVRFWQTGRQPGSRSASIRPSQSFREHALNPNERNPLIEFSSTRSGRVSFGAAALKTSPSRSTVPQEREAAVQQQQTFGESGSAALASPIKGFYD